MAYVAHGMQALIIGQNMEQFALRWGISIAAVSGVIALTGLGKFLTVWVCGEISDKIGRKPMVIIGATMYVFSFIGLLMTSDFMIANICAFAGGAATSFFDGSLYPAAQESYPKSPGSALIMIKFFVSFSGMIYPIMAANFIQSGKWEMNILIPLIASILLLILAVISPFVYDDELKGKKKLKQVGNASNPEILKAAKATQEEEERIKSRFRMKPSAVTNFLTLFYAYICMAIMYAAQQYIKRFGIAYIGMSEMDSSVLTSIYTLGSLVAVVFWAIMMGKLGWRPLKVLMIDAVGAVIAFALITLVQDVFIIQVGSFLVGFFAAGGALQTGLSLRQELFPGSKGRNTGVYYTFMGAASYTIPLIASTFTSSLETESEAVLRLMLLNLGFSIVGLLMIIYLTIQYKRIFGVSAFSKKEKLLLEVSEAKSA